MDVESVCAAVEAACRDLQHLNLRKDAESRLLAFRSSANALEASAAVLTHSRDVAAQFQAVLALRDVLILRWPMLSGEERRSQLHFLIRQTLDKAPEPQGLVRLQCAGASAAAFKRGYQDGVVDNAGCIRDVMAAGGPQAPAQHQRTSAELLTAIVNEFSPATASQMGLPWSWHETCREGLETTLLLDIFAFALTLAARAASPASQGADPEGRAVAALELLVAVLSWDFAAGRKVSWMAPADGSRPAHHSRVTALPPALWAALAAPNALDWLEPLVRSLQGLRAQRAQTGSPSPAPDRLLATVLAFAGQLAGVSCRGASSMARTQPEGANQLTAVMRVVLPCVLPAQQALWLAARGGEEALMGALHALLAAAAAHRARGFEADPQWVPGLVELTVAVLEGEGEAKDEPWLEEAQDVLLDMWMELISDPTRVTEGPTACNGLTAAAERVFAAAVRHGQMQAARAATEDEDDVEGNEEAQVEEQFERLAVIARAAPFSSLPLLSQRLEECMGHVASATQFGSNTAAPFEILCWLLQVAAFVLADDGAGEDPLPPVALSAALEHDTNTSPNPVATLSFSLLNVASACLGLVSLPQGPPSPRLMEILVVVLGRWADTYLLAEEGIVPALDASFGASGEGPHIANSLINFASACLNHFAGESQLHKKTCRRLLSSLVRRPASCAVLLRASPWHALCTSLASSSVPVGADAVRHLARVLCAAAAGSPEPSAAAAYLGGVLQAQAEEVAALAGQTEAHLQRAEVVTGLVWKLEVLRGGIMGAQLASTEALCILAAHLSQPMLSLLSKYRGRTEIVTLLLKYAVAVVQRLLLNADATQPAVRHLLDWSLELLHTYGRLNLGQTIVQRTAIHAAEIDQEQCRDLRALIRLLSGSGEVWVGISVENGSTNVQAAQTLLAALDVVIPLITPNLLKHPKLARDFFTLVAFFMESMADAVASLPAKSFQSLLSTLSFGIGFHAMELTVVQLVFESISGLAKWHVQSVQDGQAGLTQAGGHEAFVQMLQRILQRLIFEDTTSSAVDYAVDSVHALGLCCSDRMPQIRASLIRAAPDATQAAVAGTFDKLTADNILSGALDREARRAFQHRMHVFVTNARAAVRQL